MPKYLPIELPPGFHSLGVDLDSRSRWREGNLVRWRMGKIRPVGGWANLKRRISPTQTQDVTVPGSNIPRAIHLWVDNLAERQIAIGTNDELYATGADLVLKDITPSGFTPGIVGENLGYGGSYYGLDSYGTPRSPDGSVAPLSVWSLDNFGEYLVGCTSHDQNIYMWQLDDATPTAADDLDAIYAATTNAPTTKYLIVTAERFIFALGANGNPRLVAWCDREDPTVWTPQTTNEAGDYELQTSGDIVGAASVRGRTLILTTKDAFVATYLGPPNVYGFQRVSVNCGLAAPLAVVEANQGAFWMGEEAFYAYDGSSVVTLPCEVQDYVFDSLNFLQIRKAFGVANSKANEIWWFYPGDGASEVNRYVGYNYLEGYWIIGDIDRTAASDYGVFADPLWVDSDGDIWRHEVGSNHDGVDPTATSGPIMLGDGDQIMHVTKLVQDERSPQEVDFTFSTRFWPDDTEYSHGPYTTANATDVRFTGRQARMTITATDGTDWRVGGLRLEYTMGGRR